MADFDWKQIAGPLATAGGTILGGVLGGPAGAMLGPMVGHIVGQALGVDPTPDAIGPALQQPGAAEKVATAQAQTQAAVLSAQDAYLADIQSARQMTVELVRENSSIAWGAPVISLVVVVGFFAILGLLIFHGVPDSQAVLISVGALGAAFTTVLGFWVGSSKGSADKTDALTTLARRAAK
jgi:hypothetical protein